jgi:DNA-directed RNA polymerase subunit RPC12/RpoP
MGLFDEVVFRCPRCGGPAVAQTKAGPCSLNRWTVREIPERFQLRIFDSIQGEYARCEECGNPSEIEIVSTPFARLKD